MPTEAMTEKLAKGRAARADYERDDGRRELEAARRRKLLDPHNANPSPELLAAWEPIRREMQEMVDSSSWQWWVGTVHPHRFVDGVWVLACPEASRDWIKVRFWRLWEQACHAPVKFVICSQSREKEVV